MAKALRRYRQSKGAIVDGVGIIELTKGKTAKVDAEFVERVCEFGWCYSHGYALRGGGGRRIYLHHFVLQLAGIERGVGQADHKNRDTLDDQIANLRVVTRSANQVNRRLQSNNTSGYRGVYFCKDKPTKPWMAVFKRHGVSRNLGYFLTAEEAAKAYDDAALAHDELPVLNLQRAG